jgi:hypothetical protein
MIVGKWKQIISKLKDQKHNALITSFKRGSLFRSPFYYLRFLIIIAGSVLIYESVD